MNYIAHFYSTLGKDTAHQFGAIFPDFYRFRGLALHKLPPPPITNRDLREFKAGIDEHIADDIVFHKASTFKSWELQVKELAKAADLPRAARPSVIGHVLPELLIDHLLLQKYPLLYTEFLRFAMKISPHFLDSISTYIGHNDNDLYARWLSFHQNERALALTTEEGVALVLEKICRYVLKVKDWPVEEGQRLVKSAKNVVAAEFYKSVLNSSTNRLVWR